MDAETPMSANGLATCSIVNDKRHRQGRRFLAHTEMKSGLLRRA